MGFAERTKARLGRIPKFLWSKEEQSAEAIRRSNEKGKGNNPKAESECKGRERVKDGGSEVTNAVEGPGVGRRLLSSFQRCLFVFCTLIP